MQTQHPQSASPQSTHTQFSPAQFSPTNSPAIRTGLIIGLITFAALTAGVGFGCASHTPKHDSSTIGVFDAIYPRQTQPLKAESLWPIQPQQTRYARASKINGQDTDIGIYKITQNDDHIFVITLENSHESHLKINDDGSYAITRETDHKQNVTVTYDPALIILPASLTPDKPVTQTVHMTVYQRDTDHIRDQGICTNTIQLLADPPQKDHREMSRGVAYLDQKNSPPPNTTLPDTLAIVQQNRQIDLKLANVMVNVKTGYQPQHGPRVEIINQQTKALGLFSTQDYTRITIE